MSAAAETVARRSDAPEYRFIQCEHTAMNVPRIAEALSGCDTVFIEAVGESPDCIGGDFEFYNELTLGEISDEKADEVVAFYTDDCEDLDDHFTLLLARELYNSDTLLWPIDAGGNHSIYPAIENYDGSMHRFWQLIHKGLYDLPTALRDLETVLERGGYAHGLREELVVTQLEEYPKHLPEPRGKHIGVVQGAVHTSTYHAMARRNHIVSRQLIDSFGVESRQKMVFSSLENALRSKRFRPEKPLDVATLMSILIEGIVLKSMGFELYEPATDAITLHTLRTDFIDLLDVPDRSSFLTKWERAVSGPAKARKQRVRNLVSDSLSRYFEIVE